MELEEKMELHHEDTSPLPNENGAQVGLTTFLHQYRQMPAIKQQQLVSTSAAIVRNTNTITNDNEGLTREKALEVVYGIKEKERNVKPPETTGLCFVVDAHERRIRIVAKHEQKLQSSKFIHLEDIPENDHIRFGRLFSEECTSDIDGFVHCDSCNKYYDFSCQDHPLYQCHDRNPALSAPNSPSKDGEDRAALTLPGFLYIHNSHIPNAGKGVFAKVDIPAGIVFGPYEGVLYKDAKKAINDGYAWELRMGNGKPSYYIDAKDPRYSNWMRYINSPRHEAEQNLIAFQYHGSVFYRVYRPIDKNAELLVWYWKSNEGKGDIFWDNRMMLLEAIILISWFFFFRVSIGNIFGFYFPSFDFHLTQILLYGKRFGKELGIINWNAVAVKKKPFVFYPGKNPFVL